jgi:hypothetical protein
MLKVLRRPPEFALTSAVGVEDETTRRASAVDRHLQRVGYELGAHVLGERPAHNLSRRQIDDGGQVRPPLPGGDVGDVTALCVNLN